MLNKGSVIVLHWEHHQRLGCPRFRWAGEDKTAGPAQRSEGGRGPQHVCVLVFECSSPELFSLPMRANAA